MLWTVVLKKTLESPLDCREIQPVHSEGDQPWDFFGRNDAKAETPELWPPHAKSWLIGKDSDAGRDWGQEEKGMTEDEMAGWHHGLDGHESEWTPGDGDGQGGLACCDSWGLKESDTTEQLNWTELNHMPRAISATMTSRLTTPMSLSKGVHSFMQIDVLFVVQSPSHVWLFLHYELQHARLHYPSLCPGVRLNSCPLSRWCYATISSSVFPFSFCPQSFPASESFPVS